MIIFRTKSTTFGRGIWRQPFGWFVRRSLPPLTRRSRWPHPRHIYHIYKIYHVGPGNRPPHRILISDLFLKGTMTPPFAKRAH